jgi:cytochrome c biogenesis protein CcmG/thiol:disulfide interchange protein DsbE
MGEQKSSTKRSSLPTILSAAVGLVLLAVVAVAFVSSGDGGLQPGDPAPDFTLTLLDGSEVSLSDLRGQVVVLNFWASWCGPCRREAPALQQVWEAYGDDDVAFLGVAYHDAQGASRAFLDEFGITYPNGVDARARIAGMYGLTGVPETYVIDRDGTLAWKKIGELRAEELLQQLESLLP